MYQVSSLESKMRPVYINKIAYMQPNKSIAAYIGENEPKSEVYRVGLFTQDQYEAKYLDLNQSLKDAVSWLSTEIASLRITNVGLITFTTSSFFLSPSKMIDLWNSVLQNMKGSENVETNMVSGKGCNSFLYSVGMAYRRIRCGEIDRALVFCIELHDVGVNRYSDYAFFSDGVALVYLSKDEAETEIGGFSSMRASYAPDSFATRNCAEQFPMQRRPYMILSTTNTFHFLLNRKYSAIPVTIKLIKDFRIKPHMYSIDPFVNYLNGEGGADYVLHVESPPLHIDSLYLYSHVNQSS